MSEIVRRWILGVFHSKNLIGRIEEVGRVASEAPGHHSSGPVENFLSKLEGAVEHGRVAEEASPYHPDAGADGTAGRRRDVPARRGRRN